MKRVISLPSMCVLVFAVMLILVASCKKEEPDPPAPEATSIHLLTGGSQTGIAGDALKNAVEIIVKDLDDKAFEGAKVTFEVTEGSLSAGAVTTGSDGKARVTWTLGATAGVQTLTATAFKADGTTPLSGSPLTITATATKPENVPTSITLLSGADQIGFIGEKLAAPVTVIVKDQNNDQLEGATVHFAITEGSVTSDVVTTAGNGQAMVVWTLGPTEGDQTLIITAFKADGTTPLEGSPINLTANAKAYEARSIVLISGGNQSAFVGETLGQPVKVMVQNQKGQAFAGAKVHFSLTEGSVSADTVITDANGFAQVYWTLGSTVGEQSMSITAYQADGTTTVTESPLEVLATANGAIEATSIEVIAGADQTGQYGNLLTEDIVIQVKDQNGDPFTGHSIKVFFTVTDGRTDPTAGWKRTNLIGQVEIGWFLGTTEQFQSMTVTAFKDDETTPLEGSPLTVNATAIGPASIELVSGDNQVQFIGLELPEPVKFIVKDEQGNPYKNTMVNVEVTEGVVSSTSLATDYYGIASISWWLGSTEGTQNLTVTAFQIDGATHVAGSPLSVTATAEKPPAPDPVTDYDGNVYETVKIGNQVWMAENLRVTHYADGTPIPFVTGQDEWVALNFDRGFTYYDNDENSEYGALYTWSAAMNGAASSMANPSDVQGVCPDGWRLPGPWEWTELKETAGVNPGNQLKEAGTTHWDPPNTDANNISGFTVWGGGYRLTTGEFSFKGEVAAFWNTRENSSIFAYSYQFNNEDGVVSTVAYSKRGGLSVRCIKD